MADLLKSENVFLKYTRTIHSPLAIFIVVKRKQLSDTRKFGTVEIKRNMADLLKPEIAVF